MHYLYKITNQLNNKVYIGQSNKERERWRQHKYYARQVKPRQFIHRAMKKHGVENFFYEVIATCLTQMDADAIEVLLIKQYDSRNKEKGYNIAMGGDSAWNAGLPKERQPMYGKHHTKISKDKSSQSNTGVKKPPHTEEWKKEASRRLKGHKVSEETKNKISQSQIGKLVSNETREKIGESSRGRLATKETKLKMSLAQKGKAKSVKHVKNMILAHRKFSSTQELQMVALRHSGVSCEKIADQFGCSPPTVYSIMKRHREVIDG